MDLELLAKQEDILGFDRFDEDTAWSIGSKLVGIAQAQNAPVAINIRTPGSHLVSRIPCRCQTGQRYLGTSQKQSYPA